MSTEGAIIRKGRVGANTLGSADGISGLIITGVAASGLALGVVKSIFSPDDAKELGIDESYDTTNNVRAFYHVNEFYRLAGKGTKLYIMLLAQATTMTQIVEDVDDTMAKALVVASNGEVRQIGVAINPPATYVATIVDGMNADVMAAIPKAQGLVYWGYETFRPFSVLLEGRDFTGPAASAQDLRNITNVEAEEVSVIIAQDWDYAESLDALGKNHAAIGTALGAVAKVAVNQNIGEVETMNLTDAKRGAFLTSGLSSHQKASAVEKDWETLDGKGYIFAQTYSGMDGARFNDDHTCTPIKLDADGNINVHTISYGRTVAKAVRKLRTALLPKIKTRQPIDPASGKLPVGVIKYFESLGDDALGTMGTAGELSDGKSYVDPESNLLVAPRILKVGYSVVPYGSIGKIEGTINLKSSL
jgi:hypothetical protein